MRERIPSATEKGGLRPGDRTLNDLSQLTKSMIKPKEDPKPKAPPAPMAEGAVDRDAEEVLAYFSRPARDAPGSPRVASAPKPTEDRVAALEAALEAKDAALNAIAEEKVVAEEEEVTGDPELEVEDSSQSETLVPPMPEDVPEVKEAEDEPEETDDVPAEEEDSVPEGPEVVVNGPEEEISTTIEKELPPLDIKSDLDRYHMPSLDLLHDYADKRFVLPEEEIRRNVEKIKSTFNKALLLAEDSGEQIRNNKPIGYKNTIKVFVNTSNIINSIIIITFLLFISYKKR